MTLFGDSIEFVFRSLGMEETEPIYFWAVNKVRQETPSHLMQTEAVRARIDYLRGELSMILSVVYLRSKLAKQDGENSLYWRAPQKYFPKLSDWKNEFGLENYDDIQSAFYEAVGNRDLVFALENKYDEFTMLAFRLRAEASSPNFWKET